MKACLSHENITWRGNCTVSKLVRDGEIWTLLNKKGETIDQTKTVVIAASNQSAELVNTIRNGGTGTPLFPYRINFQAVRGQVSYGYLNATSTNTTSTTPYPINGAGNYIETDTEWLVGATYDRDNLSPAPRLQDQVDNFKRLENLAPDKAAHFKSDFERGLVRNWVGIRCATSDRLPAVGEVLPGLWLCTAMASRGLTFAPLCAEVIAAQILGENFGKEKPLNPRLIRALSVQRYMKK